jgi:signal transduction histidine kinase
MSPETRRGLFEPGRSTKRGEASSGLGLGLAISRQLARLSGGDVTVTCPPGGGTIFRVVLPPAE